jgi:hypothetical protein
MGLKISTRFAQPPGPRNDAGFFPGLASSQDDQGNSGRPVKVYAEKISGVVTPWLRQLRAWTKETRCWSAGWIGSQDQPETF